MSTLVLLISKFGLAVTLPSRLAADVGTVSGPNRASKREREVRRTDLLPELQCYLAVS